MNTEQNNLGYVRLYFVTANGLLLTQILMLGQQKYPDGQKGGFDARCN